MDVVLGDASANYAQAEHYIMEASDEGCDVILFSEMCFRGYTMDIDAICEADYRSLKTMIQFAKEYDITIGFGWGRIASEDSGAYAAGGIRGLNTAPLTEPGKGENHYTIVDPRGEIISDYVKIHPFTYAMEDRIFAAGEEISVYDLCGIKTATAICYDLRFPEMFEAFGEDVHLVIVPANWPAARRMHWDTLTRARAIDYQIYVAAINSHGAQGETTYSGGTKLIAPDGRILGAQPDEAGLLVVTFTDEADQIRRRFPVRDDRRPDLFLKI